MSRLNEINERLEALRTELNDLEAVEEPTEEQVTRGNDLIAEWDTLTAERTPLEERAAKVEAIRTASHTSTNRLPGSAVDDGGNTSRTRNIYDIEHLRNNPLMDSDSVRSELVSRALDAIEDLPERYSDEVRRSATETLENVQGDPAQAALHILTTGSPAYRSAFRKLLKNPNVGFLEGDELHAARAAMSLTSANGGYLLPFELDPTIILTNAGTTNQIRQIARTVQTTQNVWHGVSSAGVNMEWTAEAAEAADGSPTFSQPTVTCYKGDVYVQATFESLQDSNIESDIGMLIADAKARGEATAFTVGNGTTQPKGIVTILQATTASRVAATTNGSFGIADVYALDNNLSPRWRNNGSWLGNKSIYNLVRQMGTSAWNTFWQDFGGGLPAQLIGYNTYQASDMTSSLSAATASNDDILVLGDFKQYVIADRIGVSLVYEPLVKGASFRPTGQVGWYATWRVGGDTTNADAFRMLRV